MESILVNLFPQRLRLAAMEYYAAGALGAALLRQPVARPEQDCGPDAAPLDSAAKGLLHRHEIAQAEAYRLPKRRNEFLAGRAAAKLALAEYWAAKGRQLVLPAVAIRNDPTGRPQAWMAADDEDHQPAAEISISHGGAYGAALATAAACGVDLQEQKDTLLRVLEKYCIAEEERILAVSLPDAAPLDRLSLLWAAKEAAKKACSHRWMPGFLDLRLESIRPQAGCHVLSLGVARAPEPEGFFDPINVLATTFHQYGLAVCILNETRRHAGTARS